METEKLEQLKKNVQAFKEMFATIDELITEVEGFTDQYRLRDEVADTLSSLKDNLEGITSDLSDVESTINSASASIDETVRDIRNLLREMGR